MQERSRTDADRGQVFTLEAITAAVVLLGSLAFALQVAGVTPGTSGSSSQQAIRQQTGVASGVIDRAAATDALEPAVRYWNESNGRFHGATDEGYYTGSLPDKLALGGILASTFDDRDVIYNVNVVWVENGTIHRKHLLKQGIPNDGAVTVSRTVTLLDGEHLYGEDGNRTDTTLAGSGTFYVPDAYPNGRLYNVVRVEVVVWSV